MRQTFLESGTAEPTRCQRKSGCISIWQYCILLGSLFDKERCLETAMAKIYPGEVCILLARGEML